MGNTVWFNAIVSLVTTLGLAAIGVFGFNTAWRAYLDWKAKRDEIYNRHAKEVIELIQKNDSMFQKLRSEILELEEMIKEVGAVAHEKCESILRQSQEFRRDSLEMIKIALKLK